MQVGQDRFGMQTMNQSLFSLFSKRIITLEDALGRSPEPDEFKQMMAGSATPPSSRRPLR
jgi:twitching motility protein PilT